MKTHTHTHIYIYILGIKLHAKIIMYKVCVLTALLYASETWTLYKLNIYIYI